MNPLYKKGDLLIICPWIYGIPHPVYSGHIFNWRGVRKDEILVYNNPLENSVSVKRCVAVPGDRVIFQDGIFLLNEKPLPPGPLPPAGTFKNGVLAEGYYFCLGDNSDASIDSRIYGPIFRDHIIGKVMLGLSPPWK